MYVRTPQLKTFQCLTYNNIDSVYGQRVPMGVLESDISAKEKKKMNRELREAFGKHDMLIQQMNSFVIIYSV